jgi:hypothetical protein
MACMAPNSRVPSRMLALIVEANPITPTTPQGEGDPSRIRSLPSAPHGAIAAQTATGTPAMGGAVPSGPPDGHIRGNT